MEYGIYLRQEGGRPGFAFPEGCNDGEAQGTSREEGKPRSPSLLLKFPKLDGIIIQCINCDYHGMIIPMQLQLAVATDIVTAQQQPQPQQQNNHNCSWVETK